MMLIEDVEEFEEAFCEELEKKFLKTHSVDDLLEICLVVIDKAETGGIPFLNKKVVKEQGVKVVTITTEPTPVETEYEGKKSTKLECICDTNVLDPQQVKWQMNATTQNFLIGKFGNETKKWIGKEIELAIKQSGSAQPGIYPKDCSLEKVIA